MTLFIAVCAAYLIGSIPTGLLLGKAYGIDVRKEGSGNIGATNLYRTVGRKV
ncbi:MAG: glycerol-3-phosphate acyltransferase, partial [Desulfuromonadaceae bacterium]